MGGRVVDRDRGYAEFQRNIEKLAGEPVAVMVGVSGKTHSDMVIIAASNEFGTEDGHIPERSYLRSTMDKGAAEALSDLQEAVTKVVDGGNLDMELGRVGEKWVQKVQATIKSNVPPPNAPSTKLKKTGSRTGKTTTLIDHGRLRSSITWEIRKGQEVAV